MTAQKDMTEAARPLWLPSKSIWGEKDSSKICLLSKENDFLKNLFFRDKELTSRCLKSSYDSILLWALISIVALTP